MVDLHISWFVQMWDPLFFVVLQVLECIVYSNICSTLRSIGFLRLDAFWALVELLAINCGLPIVFVLFDDTSVYIIGWNW